jgi:hypothetical protein
MTDLDPRSSSRPAVWQAVSSAPKPSDLHVTVLAARLRVWRGMADGSRGSKANATSSAAATSTEQEISNRDEQSAPPCGGGWPRRSSSRPYERSSVADEKPASSATKDFRYMVPYLDAAAGADSGLWSAIIDASRRSSRTTSRRSRPAPSTAVPLLPQRCLATPTSLWRRNAGARLHQRTAGRYHDDDPMISTSITITVDRRSRR